MGLDCAFPLAMQIHQQLMRWLNLKAIELKMIVLPKFHSPVLIVCWIFMRKPSLFYLQRSGKISKSEGKKCTINWQKCLLRPLLPHTDTYSPHF